jgi:hypothetical protein
MNSKAWVEIGGQNLTTVSDSTWFFLLWSLLIYLSTLSTRPIDYFWVSGQFTSKFSSKQSRTGMRPWAWVRPLWQWIWRDFSTQAGDCQQEHTSQGLCWQETGSIYSKSVHCWQAGSRPGPSHDGKASCHWQSPSHTDGQADGRHEQIPPIVKLIADLRKDGYKAWQVIILIHRGGQ